MWEEHNINWDVFTREEKERVMKARRVGDINSITQMVDDMTPTKELELQKIMDALTPTAEGFESKVRKEMQKHFKKKGINGPQSPEEEAQWESKLQEEYATFLSKKEEKEKKRLESLEKGTRKSKKSDKEDDKEDVKKTKKSNK